MRSASQLGDPLTLPKAALLACALVVAISSSLGVLAEESTRPTNVTEVIATAMAKTVKIVGAGGYFGLEPYQSGLLVSPDGLVLTVWSHVLLEGDVTITLPDGRRLAAELVGVEPTLELAVLRVDTSSPQWFDLSTDSAEPKPGQWVFALHNAFGVAVGREPVSVQRGIIAGWGLLEGKRGAAGTTIESKVFFVDFVISTPGAAGGAVVDARGNLLGMIGKPVVHASTQVWANYAIPTPLLRKALEAVLTGEKERLSGASATVSTDTSITGFETKPDALSPEKLGICLVPEVVPNIPAFIEFVVPNSPADRAGLRPDDLIVTIDGQVIRTVAEFRRALQTHSGKSKLVLGLDRKGEFHTVELLLKE